MKKVIFTCLTVCFLATQSFAQSFAKGDNVVGLGVGIGGNLYSGLSYYSGINRTPAFLASYERCIVGSLWDDKSSIGVGGIVGYASAKWDDHGWGWKQTNILVGARGALHYSFTPKFDAYAGLMLGYNVVSWKWTGNYNSYLSSGSAASDVTWSGYVGARYYFTDSFGIFAELGYGYSVANVGLSLKF